jgi:hypothetical protein
VGKFKTTMSISELRQRNEATKAAVQKPQTPPPPPSKQR